MGAAILAWCAYSLLVPNVHFRFGVANIPGLLIPVMFIWIGWSWLRGERAARKKFNAELTVTLKLSDADFGTGPERHAALDLKHRLESMLQREGLGEVDGEEFGAGECSLFVLTNTANQAEAAIRKFLSAETRSLDYSLARAEIRTKHPGGTNRASG